MLSSFLIPSNAVATIDTLILPFILVSFIAPKINGYFVKNSLNIEQAEELTQEVLSTIWTKANLFDPKKSKFITWSVTIARNKKIDFYRKDKKNYFNEDDVRYF